MRRVLLGRIRAAASGGGIALPTCWYYRLKTPVIGGQVNVPSHTGQSDPVSVGQRQEVLELDRLAVQAIQVPHHDSEVHARLILHGLADDDVQRGGHWWTRPGTWRRYESPWAPGSDHPGDAIHVGTISCVYDSPARYCVTVFRVSMTSYGLRQGWTTESLCDDAFRHAGLTLADCPRAALHAPPRPFHTLMRDTGAPR